MANPSTVPATMTLYATFCPDGRTFQKGEEWPGDAWTDRLGGAPIGGESVASAMKDLIAAQDQIDNQAEIIARKDHDLAQLGAERDAAVAEVEGQKQALLDAQKAQSEAEAVAKDLTAERDAARAEAEKARGDAKAAEQLVEAANQEKAAVVEQLNAANQTIADLNTASAAKTTK